MNKQEELNKKLFNRLFLKMPTVRKIKTQIQKVSNVNLEKSIRYLYYSKKDKMWFAHSENKSKYFYFFGVHEDHITKLNHLENFIMIDFDKKNNINNHSLGIINDADETVYLNKEILEEQYPFHNFKNYKEHILTYFEKSVKIEIHALELGKLYGTFFNNLEQLIKELPLIETQKSEKPSEASNENIPNITLFLNAIKAGKNYEQSLSIAKVDSSTVKYWYNFGKKGNEKYVEFYETYKEIMPRDEETYNKMNIVIDSLKSGESEETSLSNANVNQADLKKWIKKGKNGDLEYIDFYEEYNELDKNKKNKKRTESKSKNQELIKEYIKLIDEGKTNKEAFETLNIPRHKTKNWKQQGQLGNKDFSEFYETYLKAVEREKAQKLAETKKEDEKLIKEYIKLIDEGKTNKEAFKTLNIPRYKTKKWKQQGQLENKDYTEFYETYLKAVKREEIEKSNQFIKLINEGKSNEEAMQIIKMPEFKIKQWFNNGKTGDKDFIEFYKAYMKQYDTDINVEDNIPTTNLKPAVSETTNESTKTCEICGRSMSESDPNTICKRCRRKQRCATIAQQLLLSIEPEVPFKKEDLKKLDLTSMQIQDYIWTLQEFSLIKKEKNNKLILVKKEIIDEFIEESGVEIIDEPASEIKLSKTCKICGETLEISKFPVSQNSPDGYEDNCKNCKKLITSATYLKEFLDYVQFGQEFSEDDLAKFIQDPFLRQAKVWSLLENDLLIRNEENNKLKLADEEKCKKFIDKYLNEQVSVKPEKPETTPEPTVLTKKEQMEIILNARREGKTRKESAKLAGISAYKITHWYKEGRDGFGKENINFYNKLKNIETHLLKKLKKQMNTVIKELKSGSTVNEAIDKADLTQEELDRWIKRGKNDIKPYKSFLEKYMKYVKSSIDYNDNYNTKAREKFLKYINEGKTRKEAAQKALIDLKLIDSWIIQGTKGKKPYNEFYKEYREVRKNVGGKSSSQEEIIKNEFIELLKKGYTLGEASRLIENGKYSVDIKKWYVAGKSGVSKHIKFYMKCQTAKNAYKTKKEKILTLISDGFTIKQACEKLKLEPVKIKQEILKGKNGEEPFKTFYNKLIKSKSSLINTKQLFKSPNHPHKDQMIDFLDLLLIGIKEDEALKTANIDEVTFKYWLNRGKQQFGTLYIEFYDIYNKIKSGDLIKKFKKDITLDIDNELEEIENENANILAPLPKKIRNELDNLSKETHTGFAWVNKIGNLWTYSRRINKRNIKITDIDIYNLHKKVIKNNLMWGVRNIKIAKQTLNEIGKNSVKIQNKNSEILSPLPEKIEKELNKHSKGTSTGFAWVSKSGNNFRYERKINGELIKITASTIEKLYKKVDSNNLDWGVRDFNKAKITLNEKHEHYNNKLEIDMKKFSKDIYAPFPKEYEELFKSNPSNRSGIAWVSKNGFKWYYTRQIEGKTFELSDNNIFKLHKKVLNSNQPWGIRNYEKAKMSLITKPNEDSDYIFKQTTSKISKQYPNNTGFALVNKIGEKWEYARNYDGKKITAKNIFALYEKILEKNLFWGVTDLDKAKKILDVELLVEEELKETNNNETKADISSHFKDESNTYAPDINNHDIESILKPLPDNLKNEFKPGSKDSTGFAWVRKYGSNWYYIRTVNDKQISIKDKDLRTLYEKVTNQNLTWGVRDLKKANLTLYNIPLKTENKSINLETNPKISEIISKIPNNKENNEILKELPANLKKEFEEEFEPNKTGFAWVKKIENDWIYERNLYGNNIKLKYPDLYKLHKIVTDNNFDWGVINTVKAKLTIAENIGITKSFETNESLTNETEKTNTPFFSPISKKLKSFVNTDTGFALINRNKDKWEYQIFNTNEKIIGKDIYELYEKVTQKGLLWGVTDLTKAKKSIEINDNAEIDSSNNNKGYELKNVPVGILSPLPKEIKEKLKLESNSTSTGFAWVIKSKHNYLYKKINNNKTIYVEDKNIYNLYKKVSNQNLQWGVINSYKAKKTLEQNEYMNFDKNHDAKNNVEILASLPKDIENSYFNSKINATGIAWVSKQGKNWIYSRSIEGIPVRITDDDIFELHKKVISKNLTWGVRDLQKAKQTIYGENNSQKIENDKESILKPLPIEINAKLRKNSENTSGFAWVSKVGDKWQYTKIVEGIPIHLKDKDIYKLHDIVLKNNHMWGVRDLKKAKQTLKDCNKELPKPPKIDKIPNKTIQKSFETKSPSKIDKTDILTPLPNKYLKSFKKSKTSQTGIAWVKKKGNGWEYARKVNNKNVTISDSDIYQLHKKVLDKNLPWGVIDSQKAKKIIFNAQPKSSAKIQTHDDKKEASVFIRMNGNIISIDGKIKNNEVLKVLTRIYEFGDNILKMNTQKNDNETTLSIELELNEDKRNEFIDKIKEFGWEVTQ